MSGLIAWRVLDVEDDCIGPLEDGPTGQLSARTKAIPYRVRVFVYAWEKVLGSDGADLVRCPTTALLLTARRSPGPPFLVPAPLPSVQFDVELIDSRPRRKQKWEMSVGEKLEAAAQEKEAGNAAFKKGNIAEAAAAYKEGLDYFDYYDNWTDEQKQHMHQLEVPLRLNLAS